MLIGLISCTKEKLPHPARARELYSPSHLFNGALRYLTGRAGAIYILSAKYGLLDLEQVIAPYDQTLKQATAAQRRTWAQGVVEALKRRHGSLQGITFELHAGEAYRRPLEEMLRAEGATCICPVDGLPVGKRLQFYNRAVAAGAQEVEPGTFQRRPPKGTPEGPPRRPEAAAGSAVPHSRPRALSQGSPPSLYAALRPLQGQTLHTVTGLPFLIQSVERDRVVVVPDRTGKPRPIRWMELEAAAERLGHTGELTITAIRQHASEANPAYVFALLAQLPGITLIPGRPARLRRTST